MLLVWEEKEMEKKREQMEREKTDLVKEGMFAVVSLDPISFPLSLTEKISRLLLSSK